MQKFLAVLVTTTMMSWGFDVSADSHRSERLDKQPGQGLVEDSRNNAGPKISRGRAANLAKQRFASHRVMGVSRSGSDSSPMYRVKMLSPDGVVMSVYVDGQTGEVFK